MEWILILWFHLARIPQISRIFFLPHFPEANEETYSALFEDLYVLFK